MKEFTDDDLTAIARQAALDSTHRYSYMPAMPEDAAQWVPHRWVIEAMRAILAAPVVERQEPAAYIVEAIDPNNGNLRRRGLHWHSVETVRGTRDFKEWIGENLTKEQPLYTSPPAPVAFAPTTDDFYCEFINSGVVGDELASELSHIAWNLLNKVKELNQ